MEEVPWPQERMPSTVGLSIAHNHPLEPATNVNNLSFVVLRPVDVSNGLKGVITLP